jgi:hypothetical protein
MYVFFAWKYRAYLHFWLVLFCKILLAQKLMLFLLVPLKIDLEYHHLSRVKLFSWNWSDKSDFFHLQSHWSQTNMGQLGNVEKKITGRTLKQVWGSVSHQTTRVFIWMLLTFSASFFNLQLSFEPWSIFDLIHNSKSCTFWSNLCLSLMFKIV